MRGFISFAIVFSIAFIGSRLQAQQQMKAALPQFSLQIIGKDKVSISWINPYDADLIQVNVQRSYDGVHNFKTVFSTPSPELPENGFIEPYYPGVKIYYRIFYMFSNNSYIFTKVKSTVPSLINDSLAAQLAKNDDSVTVKAEDTILTRLPYSQFLKFRDSVFTKTRDSLLLLSSDTVLLKPFVYSGPWHTSVYLFTDRSGVINLKLPMAKEKAYSLRVFEADTRIPVFTIKRVTEPDLLIDKTNFLHAGWFSFELYEDGKLKERNKLFVQKEF